MTDSTFSDHSILLQGPSFHIDLAPLDSRHLEHYSCRLLIFRCADHSQRNAQVSAFKSGLQALVTQCPILGGEVVPLSSEDPSLRNDDKDCFTIVPANGLELVVKDLRGKLAPFKELEAANFSSSLLPEKLLMPILENDDSAPACKAQYSAIEGGTVLLFTISHHVADGSGTNELMRILSEETRLASQNTSSKYGAVVGLDRSFLRNMTGEIPFKIGDHPAFTPKAAPSATPPIEEKGPHPFKATGPEISVLLRISPAGLAKLKLDATQAGAPPISTHDALSALIWRTTMLVRSLRSSSSSISSSSSTKSKIFMPSDARRHLGLPSSYIGNSVYQLIAELNLGILLSPIGLQAAASAIRAAIISVTPENVASYMIQLKEEWIEWGFMTGTSTIAVAMGTDWTSTALYTDEWGDIFGEVVRYRYPGSEEGTFNCVCPRLQDGSAEVMIGVMQGEVEFLRGREGFGRYLEM